MAQSLEEVCRWGGTPSPNFCNDSYPDLLARLVSATFLAHLIFDELQSNILPLVGISPPPLPHPPKLLDHAYALDMGILNPD